MRWRVAVFCLLVWLQFAKCHPLMNPTIVKHLRNSQDQSEIVYPRLHVTQHKRKRSLSSNSQSMLVLRTSTQTFYIQLEANNHLLQSNETVPSGHDSTDTCHYHGRLLSHIEGTAAVSICGPKNKMSGIIIVGDDAYILRPLDHLKDEENSRNHSVEPHVLFKMEEPLSDYCGVDHKKFRQSAEENETETRRYRRSDTSGRKVIETAVYVDYPLYKKLALQKKQPLKELQDTVLAIVNEVQLIYNYQSLKTKFKIVVVKLEILSEGKEAPDAAEGDIDQYLDNFCSWQSLKNPPASSELHWDHAIMLTGFDLHKVSLKNEKNAKVLGLAWVNGMCRPKHSCTLNEGSSFEAAFVIAHEMGHSLGMLHDGHGNDCDPSAYLMSEKTGPGRITWSTCSNDYLEKFFRKGLGACLEDD
ncbi:A disintegrin and metalloproteinase with thrombospondin motifs 7, partial [Stegodyphus mimosarum]